MKIEMKKIYGIQLYELYKLLLIWLYIFLNYYNENDS